MSLNYASPSFFATSEFVGAGIPWVTSSQVTTTPTSYTFPRVTRALVVKNNTTGSCDLVVGFTYNGTSGSNNFLVSPGCTERFEVKVKEVYMMSLNDTIEFSLLAELTNVLSTEMPLLSSTLGDGSDGWEGVG